MPHKYFTRCYSFYVEVNEAESDADDARISNADTSPTENRVPGPEAEKRRLKDETGELELKEDASDNDENNVNQHQRRTSLSNNAVSVNDDSMAQSQHPHSHKDDDDEDTEEEQDEELSANEMASIIMRNMRIDWGSVFDELSSKHNARISSFRDTRSTRREYPAAGNSRHPSHDAEDVTAASVDRDDVSTQITPQPHDKKDVD